MRCGLRAMRHNGILLRFATADGERWCFSPESTMAAAGQGAKNKALELFLSSKDTRTPYFHLIFLVVRCGKVIVPRGVSRCDLSECRTTKPTSPPQCCLLFQILPGRLLGERSVMKDVSRRNTHEIIPHRNRSRRSLPEGARRNAS